MADTPNVLNYYIGKGEVSFKKDGDADFRDLGNVPVFEFTPTIEQLEHFSSRSGVRTKDRTVVLEKGGQIAITLEEWNTANLAIALLGDVSSDSLGREVIEIFATNAVSGELKFKSTNEVGPRYEWHFLKVDFIPGEALSPITDEFGGLQLTGEIATVGGSFGTVTKLGEEGEANVE
jgi:hypothetical protein